MDKRKMKRGGRIAGFLCGVLAIMRAISDIVGTVTIPEDAGQLWRVFGQAGFTFADGAIILMAGGFLVWGFIPDKPRPGPPVTLPVGPLWIGLPRAIKEAKIAGVVDPAEIAMLADRFQQSFPVAVRGDHPDAEVNEAAWIWWVTQIQRGRRDLLQHLPKEVIVTDTIGGRMGDGLDWSGVDEDNFPPRLSEDTRR